jgi:hypothetical protein
VCERRNRVSETISTVAAKRHVRLIGSRIEDVRLDGGLVYIEVSHRGTDDEACTLLIRATETGWLYPEVEPIPADTTEGTA